MPTPALPAGKTTSFLTKNGTLVRIRPIEPEDIQREQDFIKNLSPETRYRRFLSTVKTIPLEQLERFTHLDYDRNMAFIALIKENGIDKESAFVVMQHCQTTRIPANSPLSLQMPGRVKG